MKERADAIRQRVRRKKYGRNGRPYPADLKAEAWMLASTMRKQGYSTRDIAKLLGIKWDTLWRWIQEGTDARMRPVQVDVEAEAIVERKAATYRLCGPNGWWVEGLTLEELGELLGVPR